MNKNLIQPFGIDIFCVGKKFLVYNMVGRHLKVKYRRSVLGLLWTLAAPLALVGIYYFVFKVILNVQTPHYLAYLVSGILLWSFFSQTIVEGMSSIVGNAGLITKIPVPLQVFPFVGTLTNLFTFITALPIILIVSWLSGVKFGGSLSLLPVYIALISVTCYSFSIIFALTYVYFDDMKHLAGIILQIWFYITPVLYQPNMIPPQYQWLIYANPIGTSFIAVRMLLIDGVWPPLIYLLATSLWSFSVMSAALLLFSYVHKDVTEYL